MALGSAPLSRQKEQICQTEVAVKGDEDKNGNFTAVGLKGMEMNELDDC